MLGFLTNGIKLLVPSTPLLVALLQGLLLNSHGAGMFIAKPPLAVSDLGPELLLRFSLGCLPVGIPGGAGLLQVLGEAGLSHLVARRRLQE